MGEDLAGPSDTPMREDGSSRGISGARLRYLERPRVSSLLDRMTTRPLTLVISPPGTGKTTAIARWTTFSDVTSISLSLGEVALDQGSLIGTFSGVLSELLTTVDPNANDPLQSAGSLEIDVRAILTRLSDLDQLPARPVVLVIEDLDRFDENLDLLKALEVLVCHSPHWLRTVLSSRRDPDIPLDRLRARGVVSELRYAQLRLSDSEASELLRSLEPSISDSQLKEIIEKADGWVAYLHMAAQALRTSSAEDGGSAPLVDCDLFIEDYIWNEIFVDEPPEMVDAMLQLSLPTRVNATLATELGLGPHGWRLLSRAERRGLFIHRSSGQWFDIHRIVRNTLLLELARRNPREVVTKRAKLAEWYESEGDIASALDQWKKAGQPRETLRLLARSCGDLYDTGQQAEIHPALATIPSHVVADPQAALELAWCHLLVDGRRFIELVDQATWWFAHETFEEPLPARLAFLRSVSATMQGDHQRGAELAREALNRVGSSWWGDPLVRFGWNMVARGIALDERWEDGSDEVRYAELGLTQDPYRRVAFEGTRALGEALSGHPVDALRHAAGLRHATPLENMTILGGEVALAEAVALREIGDRHRSFRRLEDLASVHADPMLFVRVIASTELVHAHLDRGDRTSARSALVRAEQLVDAESFMPDGREIVAITGVRMALATGDLELARLRTTRITDRFWRPICEARCQLALTDTRGALRTLQRAITRCTRHEVVFAMLRSRAADTADDAAEWATTTIEAAIANGLLQTVASEGLEMVEHLERSAPRPPEEWLGRVKRAAATNDGGRRPTVRMDLVDPLTDREWDVVRYLPSRLTVREIAAELYVSVNTLKSHMKAVYRKLGVTSRSEAAGAARTMLSTRRHEAGHLSDVNEG